MSAKVLIVIPAFNEAASIGRVINAVAKTGPEWDLLVINDCSTDATGSLAAGEQVRVIDLCYNLGIGGAVQTGFIYARDHGYTAVVQVDGDGQHDSAGIPILLDALAHSAADVVVGSRFKGLIDGYRSTALRRAGIGIIGVAVQALTGYGIRDVTSGFRAYGRRAIELASMEYPSDYPEPESLILFRKAGFSVKEVAVPMLPRRAGVSSIRGIATAYYMAKVLLALFVYTLRSRPH
jgi:glycosyltransferase involved in cell wall biosynthesis